MALIEPKIKQRVRRFIEELERYRGRHTELVSVYVPSGYDLNKIINHLQQEQSTAENIKSASTRKNVIAALEKMIGHLRLYVATPPNGLAAFSGNVAEREGEMDIKVWSIEPPLPLSIRLYRCDKEFILEPLHELLEVKDIFALIVMDRREADIALLKGKRIIPLLSTHSHVPGKFKTGGQCLAGKTLIQLSNGNIVEISQVHNPLTVKSADFRRMTLTDSKIIAKWNTSKKAIKIVTKYPRFDLICSPDHMFFVMTSHGIKEVPAELLNESSILLFPKKIKINGSPQKIEKSYKLVRRTKRSALAKLPISVTKELAQVAGYFLGDGYAEDDRLNFYESDGEVAELYSKLMKKAFNVDSVIKFKSKKNYYEIRAYSKQLVNLIRGEFFKKKSTLSSSIPKKILLSPDYIVASFLRGFFDAEGYI